MEESKSIHPIKLGQRGFALSHLFFADDILLFSRANNVDTSNLMSTMNGFLAESGLSLNYQKSQAILLFHQMPRLNLDGI